MALDRSKFKGSNSAKVTELDQQAAALAGKGGKRADTLEISDGSNRFRIYPAHPEDGGESYAEAVARVFLPAIVEDKDEKGKVKTDRAGNPLMRESQKPVFNAKTHGGFEKDLVEEYVNIGKLFAEQIDDATEKEKYLNKLVGKFDRKPEFRLPGVSYQLSWVMYADKLAPSGPDVVEFGRLEVKKSIKDKMNKVSAFEASNHPLGIDPFSDAEEGLPVVITKNVPEKGQTLKPNDYYDIALDKATDRIRKTLIEYPISNEQLEKFVTYPSLKKLFVNVFKKKDFDLQLDGLKMFDEKWELGIYESEEFLTVAEEISAYFDGEDTAPTQDQINQSQQEDVPVEEEEPQEADEYDLMSRVELVNINRKMKLGIVVKPTMRDAELKELVRTAMIVTVEDQNNTGLTQEPLPGEPGHPNYKAPAPVIKKTVTPTTSAPVTNTVIQKPAATGGDRLAGIKARMAGK